MLPLTFEFRLDPAETVRASRYLRRRQRFAWLSWAIWPMLLGLTALYRVTGTPWQELWLLGLAALFLGSLTVLVPWVQRRQFRRAYSETPGLREPQVYQFDGDRLVMSAGATTMTLGWDAILEVVETDEFFLFFYSKRCAYYLPKRAMGADSEQHRLRELLRSALGTRAAGLQKVSLSTTPT